MLFILFSAGADSYAIAAGEVEEVVPFARLKELPHTHPAIAGLLNFRGQPVPVLDMNRLLGKPPVQECFTTRILLCRGLLPSEPTRLLGVVAEKVISTRRIEPSDFRAPGASFEGAPFIGWIHEMPDGGYLQRIHPDRILPEEVARQLVATTKEAT
jgi:chemotaxis-related protein WspB